MDKFFSKYKNFSPAVKASMWYTFSSILIKGVSFFTVPIFSRVLSAEDYGKYSLYTSWVQLFTVVTTLNLFMGVYLKGLVKYEEKRNEYVSSMQILVTIITAIWLVIIIAFNGFFEQVLNLPKEFIFIMLFQILMVSAINFWSTRLRFEFRYLPFVFISLLIGIGTPIVNLVAIWFSNNPGNSMLYSFSIYQMLIGSFFFFKNLDFKTIKKSPKYWRFALKFNIPLIPYYLSQMALDQVDRVMIAHYYGQREVAMYNIPYQISMTLTIVSTSISNSFTPVLYKKIKEGSEYGLREKQNYIFILIGIACFVINLLAPEVLSFLAPKEYASGVWIIGPVVLGIYFKYAVNTFNNIEFYYEKPSISMVVSIMAAVSNVGLNAWLLPRTSYTVAGYTTLICFVLSTLIHIFFIKRMKYNQSIDIKRFIQISTVLVTVTLASQLLYSVFFLRYLLLITIIIGCYYFRASINSILGGK